MSKGGGVLPQFSKEAPSGEVGGSCELVTMSWRGAPTPRTARNANLERASPVRYTCDSFAVSHAFVKVTRFTKDVHLGSFGSKWSTFAFTLDMHELEEDGLGPLVINGERGSVLDLLSDLFGLGGSIGISARRP